MNLITKLALKNRLLHVLLASIALCFAGVAGVFSYQQQKIFHEELHRDLSALSSLISANLGGALAYGAGWVSVDVFERTLKGQLEIERAVLFAPNGEVLASYTAPGVVDEGQPAFQTEASYHTGHSHELYHPIQVGADQPLVGVLFLRGGLDHIEEEMRRFYLLQLSALVVVLLLTAVFGRKLQQVISSAHREQQRRLESEVKLRTAELQQAHDDLRAEVEERRQVQEQLLQEQQAHLKLIAKLEEAQHQLLQSEKMASIGQLAAGVAHEINNPVGFISSNMNSLSNYVDDLLKVLQTYVDADAILPRESELYAKIQLVKGEVDFDYLVADVRELLSESSEGIERVRKIVQDLKDFSHSNGQKYHWCDLHTGLDTTLNMATNEIKYKAEVVKEYGALPQVYCSQSQINQVVLNLLVNAAHAITDRGVIYLRTGHAQDRVWIEVEDTGAGIPADRLKRIFEPFFTTKPVGKGTGLGLSLSYGIVRDHGGKIEVDSQLGQGTRFRVWLPVADNAEHADEAEETSESV